MTRSSLSRIAPTLALAAGGLLIATRLVSLVTIPANSAAMQALVLGPIHAVNSLLTLFGFALLAFVLVAVHDWQASAAARFGVVALGAALVGTVIMTGDWWFEAFAVPWLADVSPGALDAVGGRLMIGGFASFVVFGVGWVLFAIASLRAHVYPARISGLILVGGALSGVTIGGAYLLGGIVLGAALVWLGRWSHAASRTGNPDPASATEGKVEFSFVK
jgi:hypothetical protein